MDPPQYNPNTLIVITSTGKILQLFTPIKAICNAATVGIPIGTTVFIEAIMLHKEHKLCYKITGVWYVYWIFTITK